MSMEILSPNPAMAISPAPVPFDSADQDMSSSPRKEVDAEMTNEEDAEGDEDLEMQSDGKGEGEVEQTGGFAAVGDEEMGIEETEGFENIVSFDETTVGGEVAEYALVDAEGAGGEGGEGAGAPEATTVETENSFVEVSIHNSTTDEAAVAATVPLPPISLPVSDALLAMLNPTPLQILFVCITPAEWTESLSSNSHLEEIDLE
ncbi:hypothetical protein BT69DRAFT_898440 [Atractiella rhizophila]|nr:hypothetical protein BT69DRAFT_898440 [Atractiella rhizophila]